MKDNMEGLDIFLENKLPMSLDERMDILTKIESLLRQNESKIIDAFLKDLGKGKVEVILSELSPLYSEINYFKKKLKKLIKPKRVRGSIKTLGCKYHVESVAYGTVFIIAPWNYPLNLSLSPLIGAISAGNRVVLKLSEYTKNINEVLIGMFSQFPEYIRMQAATPYFVESIIKKPIDMVFFTGSTRVGKIISEQAGASNLPCVLELGGKSPVIIAKDADLAAAAKKIIWAKLLNGGHTCVAPDYLVIHKDIKDKFIAELEKEAKAQMNSTRVIPRGALELFDQRIESLIHENRHDILFEVKNEMEQRFAVIEPKNERTKLWAEEIFGLILPIKTFEDIKEAVGITLKIDSSPLSFYVFTQDKLTFETIKHNTKSGSIVLNDLVIQMVNSNAPFGGYKNSGRGNYHGKHSFDTFTFKRTIMRTKATSGINLRLNINSQNIENIRKILEK